MYMVAVGNGDVGQSGGNVHSLLAPMFVILQCWLAIVVNSEKGLIQNIYNVQMLDCDVGDTIHCKQNTQSNAVTKSRGIKWGEEMI